MSDLQSVPPSKLKPSKETPENWVHTNNVLQRVLQQLEVEDRSKIVLRCDDLPVVWGDENDFENLFGSLLRMILQKRSDVPTLFLHISCLQEKNTIDSRKGLHVYSIQFNTNIKPCSAWLQQNENRLAELTAVLHKNRCTLVVNQTKASGCIFSVSLTGKSL